MTSPEWYFEFHWKLSILLFWQNRLTKQTTQPWTNSPGNQPYVNQQQTRLLTNKGKRNTSKVPESNDNLEDLPDVQSLTVVWINTDCPHYPFSVAHITRWTEKVCLLQKYIRKFQFVDSVDAVGDTLASEDEELKNNLGPNAGEYLI